MDLRLILSILLCAEVSFAEQRVSPTTTTLPPPANHTTTAPPTSTTPPPTIPPTSPRPRRPTPIVLWHGMGDSCCNPLSLGSFKAFLISTLPGVYVKSLEIGDGIVEDTMNGFFMNANKQVEEACRLIRSDSRLQGGYNAIGFSQGGQFLRAVAQRCPNGMKKLISFGGQHQGIYGFPHCFYPNHAMCNYVRIMLDKAAYLSWVQNKFVQAQYWHDPINEDEYIQKSVFLADINNERNVNSTYKQGLTALEKLVLVKFADDTMVIPKESSWFGFYTPGQGTTITDLQQSSLYIEDRLGLQEMDRDGKIDFLTSPGDHLRFTREWFINNIYKYLEPDS
uniref:Palmitoyl-protein thioesterase 1 n=1 Tax=Lygus hesperus TaxID=30085 RepID=A0A146L3N2_LYGHE